MTGKLQETGILWALNIPLWALIVLLVAYDKGEGSGAGLAVSLITALLLAVISAAVTIEIWTKK